MTEPDAMNIFGSQMRHKKKIQTPQTRPPAPSFRDNKPVSPLWLSAPASDFSRQLITPTLSPPALLGEHQTLEPGSVPTACCWHAVSM